MARKGKGLGDLPSDLVLHVLTFLDAEERVGARAVSRDWRLLVPLDPPLRLERLLLRFGSWWTAFDTVLEAGAARDLSLLLRSREDAPSLLLAPSTHANGNRRGFRVTPREVDWFDLLIACTRGHLAVVECLMLEAGVDATAMDSVAVFAASNSGHAAVVERLLQVPGVVATVLDNLSIRQAARNGHLAVVELLLQAPGVDATLGNNYAVKRGCELERPRGGGRAPAAGAGGDAFVRLDELNIQRVYYAVVF